MFVLAIEILRAERHTDRQYKDRATKPAAQWVGRGKQVGETVMSLKLPPNGW